jgi:hypothetical protein
MIQPVQKSGKTLIRLNNRQLEISNRVRVRDLPHEKPSDFNTEFRWRHPLEAGAAGRKNLACASSCCQQVESLPCSVAAAG